MPTGRAPCAARPGPGARGKGAGYGRRWRLSSRRCRVPAGASRSRRHRDPGPAGASGDRRQLLSCDVDRATPRDYEQIALQLTGHARAIASDVRRRADQLPKDSGPRALADVVLCEAEGRLSVTLEGTVRCVQSRARLVRALYEPLDRLADITSATPL